MEGSGKNRVDARAALQVNIEKRNERIQYGMKKDDGDITLSEAVKNLIEERAKESMIGKRAEKPVETFLRNENGMSFTRCFVHLKLQTKS